MMNSDVDLLAVALVREYLSRKGYKTTLNQFDKESKKRDGTIQNRKVLAEELGIMDTVIRNKDRGLEALKTFLEMLIFDLLSTKVDGSKSGRTLPPSPRIARTNSTSLDRINMTNSFDLTSPHKSNTSLNNSSRNLSSFKTTPTHQKDTIDLDFIPAANKGDIALNTSSTRLANITLNTENDTNMVSPAAAARRRKLVHNMMMQQDSPPRMASSSKKDYFSHSSGKLNGSFIESVRKNKMESSPVKEKPDFFGNTNNSSSHSNRNNNSNHNGNLNSSNNDLIENRKNLQHNERNGVDEKKTSSSNLSKRNPTDLMMSEVDVTADDIYEAELIDDGDDGGGLSFNSEDISYDTALKLKKLLFGDATKSFNKEWTQQAFKFCQHPLLKYGLVQEKGGPCGLLASVQAIVLKHLIFFPVDKKYERGTVPQPTSMHQKTILTNAFVDIFKSIIKSRNNNNNNNDKFHVTIVLPSRTPKFSTTREYRNDNLTEKLRMYYLLSENELKKFLKKNLSQFMGANGCILFLYAVVLTYGIENVRNTMDEPNGTLIGSHGYCTQEMVNLLLTGKSVSNVFDGVVELESGGPNKMILHGIKEKNDIGFLSLYEHYQSCKVGDNYKNSNYPIWVVCSESHFSVLFTTNHVTNDLTSFDMYYYDGLGRQDDEIRLTLTMKNSRHSKARMASRNNDDLTPPLEHCIRTKWGNAEVSWNGSDPLL